MNFRAAVIAGLLIAHAPFGVAQDTNIDEIKGNWKFVAQLDVACTFDGTAFIGEALEGGIACELTAHQSCPVIGQDEEVAWTVRQVCTIEREGDQVLLRSEIREFLNGNYSDSYLPDNFILTIKNGQLMEGELVSYAAHPARWTRDEDPIS